MFDLRLDQGCCPRSRSCSAEARQQHVQPLMPALPWCNVAVLEAMRVRDPYRLTTHQQGLFVSHNALPLLNC